MKNIATWERAAALIVPMLLFVMTLAWILLTRKKYAQRNFPRIRKKNFVVDEGVYNEQELSEIIAKLEMRYNRCEEKYRHLPDNERTIVYGKLKKRLEWYRMRQKELKG